MKKHCLLQKRDALLSLVLSFSLALSLIPSGIVTAATNNKLIVTPASQRLDLNTSFTVYIKSYSDSPPSTGTANGTVTFPTNLLRVKGTSPAGSGYGSPTITQSGGTINFTASKNPAPTTAITQVFSIEFQAIGAGDAIIGFAGNSRVNNATTDYVVGTVKVTDPNPPASSTPKPAPVAPAPVIVAPATPSVAVTPSANTEPVATPDPTGLVNTVAINPLYASASVTWKVNASNPTSTFAYGATASQLDKKADVIKNADGSFAATINELKPGSRYYFVISGSGDGGKSGTYSDTIITPGFPVTITVTENDVAAKNAQITIGTKTYAVGSDGKKTIGLAAGSYKGTAKTSTASMAVNLIVTAKTIPTDGTAPTSQAVIYKLTSSPLSQAPGSGNSIFTFVGVLLGGTVILGLGFVGFMAYRRRRFESGAAPTSYATSAPTVVIDDGYNWRNQAQSTQNAQSQYSPDNLEAPSVSPQMHNNSVHINDEEPLDMFEQARQKPLPASETNRVAPQDESQQNPN